MPRGEGSSAGTGPGRNVTEVTVSGVTNGDGSPVDQFYGMDAGAYYHTGLAGSAGDRSQPESTAVPDADTGLPGIGSQMHLSYLAAPGEGTATTQPGQQGTSEIAPGPGQDYHDSGAGQGSADHWPRHSWQQGRGDART